MVTLLIILYSVYLVMVGVKGNSGKLIDLLQDEGQFVSWIVIIAVVAVIGDSFSKHTAKLFFALILTAFFMRTENQKQFGENFMEVYRHFTGESKQNQNTPVEKEASNNIKNLIPFPTQLG